MLPGLPLPVEQVLFRNIFVYFEENRQKGKCGGDIAESKDKHTRSAQKHHEENNTNTTCETEHQWGPGQFGRTHKGGSAEPWWVPLSPCFLVALEFVSHTSFSPTLFVKFILRREKQLLKLDQLKLGKISFEYLFPSLSLMLS